MISIYEKISLEQKLGNSLVLISIINATSGSPGREGFKMLYFADKKPLGTVGGGELEKLAIDEAKKVFKERTNSMKEFILTENGIGMECGGKATLYFEYICSPKRAYLFGGGHLCQSLLPLLKSLDFYTIIVDNRQDFASKERFPISDEVHFVDYLEYLKDFAPKENDAIVIFTHKHSFDYDILAALNEKKISVNYLGMIGSKAKVATLLNKINNAELSNFIHSPIGLNIAKTTTSEIAIAVAAEIVAVYNKVEEIYFSKEKRLGNK